ncbi:hypothetical protein IFR05_009310 [Cadophora sp. M221]|nr:hypothetical protein IFR05_009310 [Cadophora sp. M221]
MRERRKWMAEEDEILRREVSLQVEIGQLKQWNLVAAELPGRTNKDCRKRWAKLDNNVKKGAWSTSEDEKLHAAVQELGCKWTKVAKIVSTRHADQCAKRWQNSLDPNVDHSKWDDDNEKLLSCVQRLGRNWTAIREKFFPNRTTTDLKNRYNLLIRKQRRAVEAAAPTAISGNPQINIDDRGSPRNAANEDYENDVEMGDDEEEDLEEEEDDEYEEGERPDRPVQTSLNPSVDSFVQTLENGGDNLPCNTLDYAGIESYFLDFGDVISNPQSPMDLSSNIKDGLDGWGSNPEQFMPLSTESPLSINNPSPSLQTKSPPYSDSHPQSHMIPNPDLFGFDSHGTFSPATSDSSFWNNVDCKPIPASPSQTTLVLENVDPTTLNSVMQLLIASNTKMTMKR